MRNFLLLTVFCLSAMTASAQGYISGIIYADSANSKQNDRFRVWLIVYNSTTNILSAVDSQIVSGMGMATYTFNNPASGSYRTKAAHLNGPATGTGYLPTYHSTTFSNSPILWSNASVITHTGTMNCCYHIYMAKGTVTTGPGFIGGNVTQGANKGTTGGIPGMPVYLFNSSNAPVAYTLTDAKGDYSFSNLPNGTYKVHPENMNDATTDASVVIDATHASVTGILFERSNSAKTIVPVPTGVAAFAAQRLSVEIYPNPAKNLVNISWAANSNDIATVFITDISGKKVLSAEVSMNADAAINIAALQSGFYFINIGTELGNNTQKLVIQ